MKAVIISEFGDASKLRIAEVKVPELNEKQVLVKVMAAGINPVDAKARSGLHVSSKTLNLPIILGKDFSGIIEKIGEGVKGFCVGDAVFGFANHSYAQYVAVDEQFLVKKPENLSFVEAAAVPLASLTAYQAIHEHLRLKTGESILIHSAAGGVGHFAVQLAKITGAKVIGTASAKNIKFIENLGVDLPIDYTAGPFEALTSNLDAAIDSLGGDTLYRTISCMKPLGRVVCLPSSTMNDPKAILNARKLDVELKWMMLKVHGEQFSHITQLLGNGKLRVLVEESIPMSEIIYAHKRIESHRVRGKLVITID